MFEPSYPASQAPVHAESVMLVVLPYRFTGHAVGLDVPVGQNEPFGHTVHVVPLTYAPASHVVHAPALSLIQPGLQVHVIKGAEFES